jgi:hypothetical protein
LALLDSSATENRFAEESLPSTVLEQPEVTRWGSVWRQRLVVTSLVFSDILVAVLIVKRLKLWGKPIIIVGYPDTRAKLVDHLEEEWGLGYQPVSLSDHHLTPAGEAFRAIAYAEALAEAHEDRSSGGRPTSLHSQYLLH